MLEMGLGVEEVLTQIAMPTMREVIRALVLGGSNKELWVRI